jgi:nuclear pore complex protein Nup210
MWVFHAQVPFSIDAMPSILLIKWKTGSESFVVVNASQESSYLETVPNSQVSDGGFPCSWTHIYASNTGQGIIRVTLPLEYHQFNQELENNNLCFI